MKQCLQFTVLCLFVASVAGAQGASRSDLYRVPDGVESRWVSFENPTGAKGEGGKSNKGGKGNPCQLLPAGQTQTLLELQGSGEIRRMWFTIRERDPQMLRALRLDMYWDGAATPAVSVPFGDFFCAILGRPVAMENEFFCNPEGRSFNCYIPMPFHNGAKVTLTNESKRDVVQLFYDIDCIVTAKPDPDALCFHAYWRRETSTTLNKDFEILPAVKGKGRFVGAHIGVIAHPENVGWWGEGEVKMYVDGDTDWPTIVGTGTEDYIGTGWGQGLFQRRYQGSLVADGEHLQYGFYRYHVPEPICFHRDLRVTIQHMGGASKKEVVEMQKAGVEIQPVSIANDNQGRFVRLLESPEPVDLAAHDSPDVAWVNYYRRDDFCAVALFYLDRPENGLPPLAPVEQRIEGMIDKPYETK
ncbi:MAG: DUF2961 domain-containing protein [Candidatus Hydrogenedentes bacterium]|nr:DUF2961 domain-containing protein [Candidatus Hydrogenedentota bacterium]